MIIFIWSLYFILQNLPEAFTASNVATFPYDFSPAATPVTKTLKIDGTTSGSHYILTLNGYNTIKLSFWCTTKLCLQCYKAGPRNLPLLRIVFFWADKMAVWLQLIKNDLLSKGVQTISWNNLEITVFNFLIKVEKWITLMHWQIY